MRAIVAVVVVTLAVLVLAHVVAAKPWDTAASATCDRLASDHVAAETAFLTATDEADRLKAGQLRDHTFAELGMQCTWEAAQAADMQAHVNLR